MACGGPDQAEPVSVVAITLLQMPNLCCPKECEENTEFIAQARSDVPRLVAEVRRLKKQLQKLQVGRKR